MTYVTYYYSKTTHDITTLSYHKINAYNDPLKGYYLFKLKRCPMEKNCC